MSSPPESPSGWRPGSLVGEWVLGEELGAGGMGTVFAARHRTTQVAGAIKVLTGGVDPEILLRFQREGQAQALVDDHPAILRVRGAGEAWGRPYLVQEYAPGGDLAARLRRGPLPPEQARALLAQLAGGVEHLHRAGILHRDLKPENVLFDGEGRPRLTDFGLARFAGAESLTETGTLLGTPAYMAPEQAQGLALDARTDVYALGALLFACLTGRAPIQGPSVLVLLGRILEDTPPAPSSLVKGVPADLDAVCSRALAKDPNQRYASAAEFAEALIPTGTVSPSLSKGALAGAGLLVMLTLGVVTIFSPLPTPTQPSPTTRFSRAPSATPTPRQAAHALDPRYRRERIEQRKFAPYRVEFIAPGRLLTRTRLADADDPRQSLELWEVRSDGELNKLWEQRETRHAVLKGGRLLWLEIKPDHSLVFEACPTFPTQSSPYADRCLIRAGHLLYVSPSGRRLAWRDNVGAHSGTLRLYDLERSQVAPHHQRQGVNLAWVGEFAMAAIRLGLPRQSLESPTLCIDDLLPTGQVAAKSRRLEERPQAIWGSATAVWVGFADGSLLEVPRDSEKEERSYAHAPGGRQGGNPRGSRVREIRPSRDYLFATTYSRSTPSNSQLVAWRRGSGVSTPIEVVRFPARSCPTPLALDPQRGLIAVGLSNTSHGLWILRLHE